MSMKMLSWFALGETWRPWTWRFVGSPVFMSLITWTVTLSPGHITSVGPGKVPS